MMTNMCLTTRLGITLAMVLATLGFAVPVSVASAPYIPVGQAKSKKSVIAITEIRSTPAEVELKKTINDTIVNDLAFMELFKFLGSAAFIENPGEAGITPGTFKMSNWTGIGADFLLKSSLSTAGKNITFEAHLYDTHGAKELLAKRYVATAQEAKMLAHTVANNIIETLTGLPGIFLTKIAMSCERRKGAKEIHVMNFDGTEVKQITQHSSVAFSPAWSPDGARIAYSVINKQRDNVKNIDLFEFNLTNQTIRMLSNRKGINSGAAYSPDGKKIALTMSFLGNPEIFSLDPATNIVTRLSKSFGFDVDPAWSPDGNNLAFVSSRTGVPMVFKMTADGSKVDRLTYAGRYNATPSWSPQNNKIAFAGWTDQRFDIFIMNPDGTNIERLTKGQGNNEDPHFSADGNFIAFSSNRTGQQNIYLMNVDGSYIKRLTYGLGNCASPKWSPPTTPALTAATK